MTGISEQSAPSRLAVLVPPAVAALLLFIGLGGFGLWEPHETAVLDAALEPASPGDVLASPLTRLLTSASVALIGRGETGARLPGAVLCWLAVLVVHLTMISLGNRRAAAFGTLAFASSSVCLFHGRQLTGDAALLLAQTAATAGLALFAFASKRGTGLAGAALAATGLVTGVLEAGLLTGAVLPAATVLAALALSGDVARIFSAGERSHPRRAAAAVVAAAVILGAAGVYLATVLRDVPDQRIITGGLAAAPFSWPGFHGSLELLVFGWFPWIVVAPLALRTLFAGEGEDAPLPALALAGIAVGCLIHVADSAVRGPTPLFLALPLAAAVGLALGRLERSRAPAALGTAFALVFAAVLIRDFVQNPDAVLRAHGFEDVALPDGFAPAAEAALAGLPFGGLLVLLGFFPSRPPAAGGRRYDWRAAGGSLLAPLAAGAIGGWIAFSMVPDLSYALSPRHVFDTFTELREGDEPLAVLGEIPSLPEARRLESSGDLVRWLDGADRVFALMPPRHLATLDRSFRRRHGRHLHVADRRSDQFWLVTNRPRPGEENENPLAGFVFSGDFAAPPPNALDVDFGGRIALLGWDLRSGPETGSLRRGRTSRLATYWRCDAPPAGDYRIFVHFDGPGPRINWDHVPVRGALPTRDWRPGDLVIDVHEGTPLATQPAGIYTLRIGLFRGGTRLAVADPAQGDDNAVVLGRVELK